MSYATALCPLLPAFTTSPPFPNEYKQTNSQRQQPTVDMPGWPKSFAL